VAASTSRARQESVPIKKATSAKKPPAKKASLKSVDNAPAQVPAAQPVADDEVALPAGPEVVDEAVEEALEELRVLAVRTGCHASQ
jgi:hypothetical protein